MNNLTPHMRALMKPNPAKQMVTQPVGGGGPAPAPQQIPPEWQVQPQAPDLSQGPRPPMGFLPQGPGGDLTIQGQQPPIPIQPPQSGQSQFDALRQRYEGMTNMGDFEIDPFNPEEILQYRRRF